MLYFLEVIVPKYLIFEGRSLNREFSNTDSEPQWVGFHLSIHMGYVESGPFFCAATETIKDTVNNNMHKIWKAPVHMMEILADTPPIDRDHVREREEASAYKSWDNIPVQAKKAALLQVEVYLDYFIGVLQEGPAERRQMTRHFFQSIDELFHPNNTLEVAR